MTQPVTEDAELLVSLMAAWRKYTELFGEPPRGTVRQLAALLELMPNRLLQDNAEKAARLDKGVAEIQQSIAEHWPYAGIPTEFEKGRLSAFRKMAAIFGAKGECCGR